ncbi:hypothetical protein [uncultured Cohaesibacter sp.]|uniref:hypothetical protein n=1 Tax=uncultured Cohaesibacter sp. TaxID=1002546 RepID=UPI00292D8048|nr:hypothetical protein [uncultured Cohaesibacter sp.]
MALGIMWLQIIGFSAHLSAQAAASAGASQTSAFYGMICSAQGLIQTGQGNGDQPVADSDICALCALGAMSDDQIGENPSTGVQSQPKHRDNTSPWTIASAELKQGISPRVGASRAPPSVL